MTSPPGPDSIAEAIRTFFAQHGVAGLRLPSGWFGRSHDNWHQLSEVAVDGEHVVVRLDDRQTLRLEAQGMSLDDRVLRVTIRGGRWDWTEYGGDQEHTEVLAPGSVEFHGPSHR